MNSYQSTWPKKRLHSMRQVNHRLRTGMMVSRARDRSKALILVRRGEDVKLKAWPQEAEAPCSCVSVHLKLFGRSFWMTDAVLDRSKALILVRRGEDVKLKAWPQEAEAPCSCVSVHLKL